MAHIHFGTCYPALCIMSTLILAEILADNQLHSFHYSISCLFVKLVWMTDLISSTLVQYLRRSYYFGMIGPVPFLFANFSAIPCSCSWMLCMILLFSQDTVIFCVPYVLTGHIWLQYPIGTTTNWGCLGLLT